MPAAAAAAWSAAPADAAAMSKGLAALGDIQQTLHAMNDNITRLYEITRDHYPQGQ
jgi:hypothetical protein